MFCQEDYLSPCLLSHSQISSFFSSTTSLSSSPHHKVTHFPVANHPNTTKPWNVLALPAVSQLLLLTGTAHLHSCTTFSVDAWQVQSSLQIRRFHSGHQAPFAITTTTTSVQSPGEVSYCLNALKTSDCSYVDLLPFWPYISHSHSHFIFSLLIDLEIIPGEISDVKESKTSFGSCLTIEKGEEY